jgi:hypothetical protein
MQTTTALKRTHDTYDTLCNTWTLLQQAYRGDGGFLDGSNLIAHPREIIYERNADGSPSTTVQGHRDKYTRRKNLARYENFARTIVDTFLAHLFSKPVLRKAETMPELEAWWQDVDGAGQHIADWMLQQQALAFVYGHVVVLMDRLRAAEAPRTKAEQGAPILRCYGPLDVPDWLWTDGRYQAVKLLDTVPRTSLLGDDDDEDTTLVYDTERWERYSDEGVLIDAGAHGFGVCPVEIHRARGVPGMPDVGASILGDPKLFQDHYNLLSELREMLRGQVFSMLNIQLGQDEDVGVARGRLGDAASVETIVWSKGPAGFIQPDKGPAEVYEAELEALERKLFRLAGLPWEGDSRDAESADSRRLKAMDLNRMLALYADEAERVEYALVKLWYRATTGVTDAEDVDAAVRKVVIHYPDEFATIDIAQAASDVRDVVTAQLGKTATAEMRKRAARIVLTDANEELLDTIDAEIDALGAQQAASPQQAAASFRERVVGAAPVAPTAGTQPMPTTVQ